MYAYIDYTVYIYIQYMYVCMYVCMCTRVYLRLIKDVLCWLLTRPTDVTGFKSTPPRCVYICNIETVALFGFLCGFWK
jgi:hypothetical protein